MDTFLRLAVVWAEWSVTTVLKDNKASRAESAKTRPAWLCDESDTDSWCAATCALHLPLNGLITCVCGTNILFTHTACFAGSYL